eukprot:CAMPEP_0185593006 /NCGR_PEP_ID=MMETSP0434-20130131/70008_1 /TAXON_ID=626734 ORGANISM="Favella taraikaensis, Strain Fe Narragansett Bay" /NCGR_SAMPLE_ID=MMETSP0434 /ASSEMBLY_ACC=CAM_ASM_000379 /LENGTH=85 /DNA_ID=CAMNT_0028219263 /DNA_START=387 /DNA_END=641 /DNA_ORIENTATION=-
MVELMNSLRGKYVVGSAKAANPDGVALADCILTKINKEGVVTGFTIRPEMMKVVMYRSDRQDTAFMVRVIRTVNLMNRVFFKSDE